jgi:hypothetical protein
MATSAVQYSELCVAVSNRSWGDVRRLIEAGAAIEGEVPNWDTDLMSFVQHPVASCRTIEGTVAFYRGVYDDLAKQKKPLLDDEEKSRRTLGIVNGTDGQGFALHPSASWWQKLVYPIIAILLRKLLDSASVDQRPSEDFLWLESRIKAA